MVLTERAIADYLTLIIGKLTNWNAPRGGEGPGDPAYLNAEQAEELAAAGIRMLAQQLPRETAQTIEAALTKYQHGHRVNLEEALLNVGSLGGVLHHGSSGPPGCCVMINGHLVCIRAEQAARASS
jgi:hypothetical protein